MKSIAIRYGVLFFVGLVLFFITSYLLGVSGKYELRLANGLFHLVALYYGIKQLRMDRPKTHHNYVSGVAQGMYVGSVGTFLFTIFMVIFLAANPAFLAELQSSSGLNKALTPFTGGVFIFLEGIGVSLIASYILTRYVDMRLERKMGERSVYAK